VRFNFTPQRREFFELFAQASANTVDISRLLCQLLDGFPDHGAELIGQIKSLEHTGDRLTREVVDLLNRTFVTPFDREDIYRLAAALDDVCDNVDEAADNLGSYGASSVPSKARAQADVILRATMRLDEAVQRLDGFKDSSESLEALRALEDEGDILLRDAVSDLFRNEPDARQIIRWKDVHERLEEAVDSCEEAADVLEAIFVKNR
jgi:uncharacterized protein